MTGNWPTYLQKTSGTTTLNQSRTHNVVNELTAAGSWATPVHDRAGNMTTVPKPSSLTNGLTLKFDAWNRVVEVKDGATVVGKYEYDAIGRRVKRHIDSQSPASPNGIDRYEHLFYDRMQVIETRATTNVNDAAQNIQPKYQYVWSRRYIDAPILRDENTDNDSLCDDARVYYLNDANMNVTSLVDTAGDALERYVYDPYGRVTIYDSTWSNTRSTSNYSNTVLYSGREQDPESGLYFYRARYYSAELGRFIGRDPIEYYGGINQYSYVANRPTKYLDPMGLWWSGDSIPCIEWGDVNMNPPLPKSPYAGKFKCPPGFDKYRDDPVVDIDWVVLAVKNATISGFYDGVIFDTPYMYQGTFTLYRERKHRYVPVRCRRYFVRHTECGWEKGYFEGPGGYEDGTYSWGRWQAEFTGDKYPGVSTVDLGDGMNVLSVVGLIVKVGCMAF